MKRLSLRFPLWARGIFSVSLLTSLVTGSMWFCLAKWGEIDGEFGPEKHPWIAPLIKIHGAAAFVAMVSFGMILAGHVPAGWRAGWSKRSGIFSLSAISLSIVTAYGLYYSGDEVLREKLAWIHLASGVCIPVAIALHVWAGRRHRRG